MGWRTSVLAGFGLLVVGFASFFFADDPAEPTETVPREAGTSEQPSARPELHSAQAAGLPTRPGATAPAVHAEEPAPFASEALAFSPAPPEARHRPSERGRSKIPARSEPPQAWEAAIDACAERSAEVEAHPCSALRVGGSGGRAP